MVRGFEIVYEIISDLSKWKPRKQKLTGAIYKEKNGQTETKLKQLFTTWECPSYKKSSQQLPSCVIATRLAVLQNVFLLWARKDVEKVFEETVYKKYEE